MKQLIVATTLLSATLLAQSSFSADVPHVSPPANGPSYSQLYCSGFITRHSISRTSFVLGSKESPQEDRYPGRSVLFLRGPALIEGQRYSLLRQIEDPNRENSSPEQRAKLAELGSLYEDVGWVTVKSVEKRTAIASFDFSCDAAVPGDIVVPFQERPELEFRTTEPEIGSFRTSTSAVKGHILGSKDFLGLLGTGLIVYTDLGSAKGAKPGDYLLVMRGYAPGDLNKIDRITERLPMGAEDTAVKPAKVTPHSDKHMPNHVLGELLVLNVTRESSTAMISRASAEMELGDVVEAERGASQTADISAENHDPCHLASRLRRMLFLGHGCKAAR